MKNIRNYGMVTGRLTADPDVRVNADGSRKVRFTVAVQNSYADKDGKRGSQFLPLEAFISADRSGDGAYGCINGGEKVYGLVLLVSEIALLETKASKAARRARANSNTSAA